MASIEERVRDLIVEQLVQAVLRNFRDLREDFANGGVVIDVHTELLLRGCCHQDFGKSGNAGENFTKAVSPHRAHSHFPGLVTQLHKADIVVDHFLDLLINDKDFKNAFATAISSCPAIVATRSIHKGGLLGSFLCKTEDLQFIL